MTTESYVRARIDPNIKSDANDYLKSQGLTMSEFIRITITNLAINKTMPFDIESRPNATTLQAMDETREIGKRLEEKYRGFLFDD